MVTTKPTDQPVFVVSAQPPMHGLMRWCTEGAATAAAPNYTITLWAKLRSSLVAG